MSFIEELKWRRMLHDVMPETEAYLNKGMAKGYIGFDPTADSLGVGNLVQIMTLLHFQKAGHKPFALVGGATGMVGDPSGKSAERNLLDEETLNHNQACQLAQLKKFLDFNCGENSAEIVNNYDWFKNFTFLDFIRDIGKHISVNYMMAKDSVKSRLESGMSFTEFSYQLVQGYDFYYLNKHLGVKLQMGGSDQWGNIVTGTELIRRKDGASAYALTTPLIKKADGTKFGKTEGGNIWLDPKKTSAYKFYQFWLNSSDEDVKTYIRIFTLKTKAEIEGLEVEHDQSPHLRLLQNALADDITIRVHGVEELEKAKSASKMLFGESTGEDLKKLESDMISEIFEGVPSGSVSQTEISNGINILDLLVSTKACASKGEARRLMQQGGLRVNKEKFDNAEGVINADFLLKDKFILIQKGKKNYHLVTVE